ncbi:hypothetical protein Ciccas_014057 [Cichlidogyrus casuarinus]|uniref:UspA domain-containing protein n=1 Tax=Cichlidogyrus casuarinus TaxID=1844966 RepID=A0ABD2PJ08_9PLAT
MSSKHRKVLIAVDASEHSRWSFDWYLDHIMRPDDHVHFYHVFEAPSLPPISMSNLTNIPTEEWGNRLQEKIQSIAMMEQDYQTDCQRKQLKCSFINENRDHTGESICEEAVKCNATLILVGSRGLGALKRTILGSVSDYVLHHSKVPVLMVPPKK